jgi:hypothetical protein
MLVPDIAPWRVVDGVERRPWCTKVAWDTTGQRNHDNKISTKNNHLILRQIFEQQKYPKYLDDFRWPAQEKYLSTGSRLDPESNGRAAVHLRFSMPSEAGAVPLPWSLTCILNTRAPATTNRQTEYAGTKNMSDCCNRYCATILNSRTKI